jgi:hypothetical protein
MKIAILLFGQPRFVNNEKVIQSYENLRNTYDVDFFCHSWIDNESNYFNCSSWSGLKDLKNIKDADIFIKNFYRPKRYIFEAPKAFSFNNKIQKHLDDNWTNFSNHWSVNNYSNILSQLYSIQKVSNLASSFKDDYDFYILGRYDTYLENFPDLNSLDVDKLHLSNHHNKFPDMVFLYGKRFLLWSNNVFDDQNDVYIKIWEPSAEFFKANSFFKRFNEEDLMPNKMMAYAIRS